jgi:hypothetical protein
MQTDAQMVETRGGGWTASGGVFEWRAAYRMMRAFKNT